MASPFMFEKPLGMQDTLPFLYKLEQKIKQQLTDEMEKWGYDFMRTPALEYYETVGKTSPIDEDRLFKLLDRQGRAVVLRPDMTVPIARVLASGLSDVPLPQRIGYSSPLYRKQQYEGGRPAEFEQMGVELVGDGTASADAEVIALMIHLLKKAGARRIKVALGHAEFVQAFLNQIFGQPSRSEGLRQYLYEKNDVGFRHSVQSFGLSSIDETKLNQFIHSRRLGNQETLALIPKLLEGDAGARIHHNFQQLMDVLAGYGVEEAIDVDLTMVSHLNYYTGFVFEAFGGESGVPLGNGGRYDELLEKFRRPASATGFGIRLDHLTQTLQAEHQSDEKQCIIYSKARQEEALKQATELRNQGMTVVLQDIDGIKDIDRFTNTFSNVDYYVGNRQREEG